jgi:hypothetical protein
MPTSLTHEYYESSCSSEFSERELVLDSCSSALQTSTHTSQTSTRVRGCIDCNYIFTHVHNTGLQLNDMFVSTVLYGIPAGPSPPMGIAWCRGVAAGRRCVVASQRPQGSCRWDSMRAASCNVAVSWSCGVVAWCRSGGASLCYGVLAVSCWYGVIRSVAQS